MSILWKLQCALRIFRISSIFICAFLYFHLKMKNSRMKTSFQTKCIAYGALSHVFNIIAAFCFANNLHLFYFFSSCNRLSDTTTWIYHLLMIMSAWFFFLFIFAWHNGIAIQTGELLFIWQHLTHHTFRYKNFVYWLP